MFPKLYHSNKNARKLIIGIDEVGVGPLAGPVTAAAVTGPARFLNLRDSKKLSPKQREEFYRLFCGNKDIVWAVASVMPKTIDRINILQARRLVMARAAKKLTADLGLSLRRVLTRGERPRQITAPVLLLIDGITKIDVPFAQMAIVKGDERVPIIAVSSIIAKVTRDRMMVRYHKKYPQYRFDLHKGYGTSLHYEMLAKHGLCPIHRRTFRLTKYML